MIEKENLSEDFWIQAKSTSSIGTQDLSTDFITDQLHQMHMKISDFEISKIMQDDFRIFDFIIAMDQHQFKLVKKQAGIYRDKIYMLTDIDLKTKGQSAVDLGNDEQNQKLVKMLNHLLHLWVEMFKENKLLHFIDLEDYLIKEKPYFLQNPQYVYWDLEEKRFQIRESAPDDVIDSYEAFYEVEEQNEN